MINAQAIINQLAKGQLVSRGTVVELAHALLKAQTFQDAAIALLPQSYYMDPPDGGSVTPLEQLERMAEDAAKWEQQSAAVVPTYQSVALAGDRGLVNDKYLLNLADEEIRQLRAAHPAPSSDPHPRDKCSCAHIGECDGSCAPYITGA